MKKLLIVCGPTATGKTALGLKLAKEFNGEIISADSRQVYRGMDIGTGKDLDPQAGYKIIKNGLGYYEVQGVRIFGYDLVDPDREFSVSQYLKTARKAIDEIRGKKKLPIVVGGTGFYIKGIVDGIPTVNVPRNENLRTQLESKSTAELFETLSQIDSIKAGSLNSSDKKNPRRLVRAIEVAQYQIDHKLPKEYLKPTQKDDTLFIGLSAAKEFIADRIRQRVDRRFLDGMKKEIENLLKKGVGWEAQSMYSLGYRQYRDFFEGGVDEEYVVSEWIREEIRYSIRQMVWFKKDPRINWFDIRKADYTENVAKMVRKWHNLDNDQKG